MGESDGINDRRHGSEDSGYFSRRTSKAVSFGGSMRDSILLEELEEMVEMIKKEGDDEGVEEVADEGDDLEDDEDEDVGNQVRRLNTKTNSHHAMEHDQTAQSTALTQTAATPSHPHQPLPQSRIGTRFISPQRPVQPRLSADEAVVAGAGYKGVGK